MRTLIKGGTILTMETGAQPFQGDLWIVDERIASVVRYPDEAGEGRGRTEEQGRENSQLPCSQPDRIIEAKGMAVMPGLVNSHQHTPMSLLRGFSNDLKLMDWLHQKMLPAEANMNREDIYWGAKLAMAEMIRSGTTAFADMYIEMDSIASAVVETGMRASLTRGLVFMQDDGGIRMREAVDLIDRWSGAADGRITTMIGPHSPYLCPPQPMQEVIAFARERGIPVHIHLAETREEVVRIRERYDRTPTEYLHQLGLFDSLHVLLAHAVHLTHKDIRLLGGMKGGVAHNPVSN
ncbi:amidohydrolase family protein, partial [Paenibacillus sepulcri]|nr:amidohydrolase family protein [Paenibacillus sepulcri]